MKKGNVTVFIVENDKKKKKKKKNELQLLNIATAKKPW